MHALPDQLHLQPPAPCQTYLGPHHQQLPQLRLVPVQPLLQARVARLLRLLLSLGADLRSSCLWLRLRGRAGLGRGLCATCFGGRRSTRGALLAAVSGSQTGPPGLVSHLSSHSQCRKRERRKQFSERGGRLGTDRNLGITRRLARFVSPSRSNHSEPTKHLYASTSTPPHHVSRTSSRGRPTTSETPKGPPLRPPQHSVQLVQPRENQRRSGLATRLLRITVGGLTRSARRRRARGSSQADWSPRRTRQT